jgi:hypothetical protein
MAKSMDRIEIENERKRGYMIDAHSVTWRLKNLSRTVVFDSFISSLNLHVFALVASPFFPAGHYSCVIDA